MTTPGTSPKAQSSPTPAIHASKVRFVRLKWLWGFYILAICAAMIGLFGKWQIDQATSNAEHDIYSKVEAYANSVEQWRSSTLAALEQPQSGAMATLLQGLQRTPQGEQEEKVKNRLNFYLQRHTDVSALWLHDANGRALAGTAPLSQALQPDLVTPTGEDLPNQAVRILDFDKNSNGQIRLHIIAPLKIGLRNPQEEMLIGYAVFEITPYNYLYPELKRGWDKGGTDDVYLVRQKEKSAEFISPLRYSKESPLQLRIPLSDDRFIAIKATHQPDAQILYGLDYRQVESIASAIPIAGTNWWIIAKQDQSQVTADARRHTLIFSLVLLSFLAIGSFIFLQNYRLGLSEARTSQSELDRQTLRMFIDSVEESLSMIDREGKIYAINQKGAERFGSQPEMMLGKSIWDMTPDYIAVERKALVKQALETGEPAILHDHRQGMALETRIYPQPEKGMVVVISADITERLALEQANEQTMTLLRRFLDHMPGAAYIKNSDLQLLVANQGFKTLWGMDPERIVGLHNRDIFEGSFGHKITEDDLAILQSGEMLMVEERYGDRWYETTKFPIPREGHSPYLGGITIDITPRVRNNHRNRALIKIHELDNTLDEMGLLSGGLDLSEQLTGSAISFLHVINEDQENLELTVWSSNTMQSCQMQEDSHHKISHAGIWAESVHARQPVICNNYPEHPGRHGQPAGHNPIQRFATVPILDRGVVRMIIGLGNKQSDYDGWDIDTIQLLGNELWRIIRRRKAEAALRSALRVVEASPVVMFRWAPGPDRAIIYVSDNISQWGYKPTDLIDEKASFQDLVAPGDINRCREEATRYQEAGANEYNQEYRIRTAEGHDIWVSDHTMVKRDDTGSILFFEGVIANINAIKQKEQEISGALQAQRDLNKKLEEAHGQLLQSEKLAAIGQLAAGVAHELNNPIGFVHSNLGTLTDYVRGLIDLCDIYSLPKPATPEEGALRERDIERLTREIDYSYIHSDIFPLLDESREGLTRVRKIVQDLRDFSREGSKEWEWADLHQGLDSTLNIAWNEIKYKCTVQKRYGDIPRVQCVMSQMNQVFLNLIVNASQAIEIKGEITISTGMEGSDHVWISISDTGKGIPQEIQNRIFEPFFTTKPVGVGTGLGLSLVFGILERHHGHIELESKVGEGSTFRIVLPINQTEQSIASDKLP